MEINQYNLTISTHYDITIGNDVARDAHCEITMDNDIARDIHCDVTISNDIAMCTYHGITMNIDIAMKLLYYVVSALCLIMILLWVVCNENKNNFIFDQSWVAELLIHYFCVGLFQIHTSFRLVKYPYTKTTYVFSPH